MPHTRYHRRHHTWPHCGSELCMREPRGLEIHVSKPGNAPATYISGTFQQAVPAPLISDELLCDDMGMPELTRQPRRMARLWFRSSNRERNEQVTLSGSSGQTRNAYRNVLRRLTRRPPLSKSHSLFVVPSNMGAGVPYVTRGSIIPGGLTQQADLSGLSMGTWIVPGSNTARVTGERRHRRCHSEQPRAWRKPSATLWTLQEHEE